MRCPSCNKMAAYDTSAEPELDLEVDEETGVVTGTVRIVLTSECCGEELKEANFDVAIDPGEIKHAGGCAGPEFSISSESAELTDRYESTKTKKLKSGKVKVTQIPSRYQRHYFGVAVEVTVECQCGAKADGSFTDEVQASDMDELV